MMLALVCVNMVIFSLLGTLQGEKIDSSWEMLQMVYLASPACIDQRCIYLHDFVCIVTIYLGPCSHLTFRRVGKEWAILPLGLDGASPLYRPCLHFLLPAKHSFLTASENIWLCYLMGPGGVWSVPNLRAIAKCHGSHYVDSTPVALVLSSCRFKLWPQRQRIPVSHFQLGSWPLPLVMRHLCVCAQSVAYRHGWQTTVPDLFRAGTVSPQSGAQRASDPMDNLEMLKRALENLVLDLGIPPPGASHWSSHL